MCLLFSCLYHDVMGAMSSCIIFRQSAVPEEEVSVAASCRASLDCRAGHVSTVEPVMSRVGDKNRDDNMTAR